MRTIITITAFFVCSLLTAQTQYETGMQKALSLWGEGKTTEATALFERIATVEKNNWLPSYYIGMINAVEAFNPKNKEKATALIEKAQNAVDNATLISPNNAEIMVLQAMVYTAILVQDPMTNGMKYSGLAMEQYYKALAIAPNNPRVVFSKAEFELGGAKWSGADTKPICAQIAKATELFATFKPETVFHPNWGEDRAKEALKSCK